MLVTTADFHANMDKYLAMLHSEDILITSDGKPIAQMTAPKTRTPVEALRGLLKGVDADAKSIRQERLNRYEGAV